MCKIKGDEFIKNVNLISFNHVNFKNLGEPSKQIKLFFILYFKEFIKNENFVKIFSNLLMDAKNEYTVSEIFNGLNLKFNLNIEQQIKLIISFIDSGVEKYFEEANLLFLEKCKEIYEKKMFLEFQSNIIVEKMISILFNILKIKNRQDNINSNNEIKEKNDNDENNIQLYIQSFSHCNEQLKTMIMNKGNILNNDNEENNKIESNIFDNNNIKTVIEIDKILYELGPLIINQKINLFELKYIDIFLDLDRIKDLILFI
jgi:hypothetical protein